MFKMKKSTLFFSLLECLKKVSKFFDQLKNRSTSCRSIGQTQLATTSIGVRIQEVYVKWILIDQSQMKKMLRFNESYEGREIVVHSSLQCAHTIVSLLQETRVSALGSLRGPGVKVWECIMEKNNGKSQKF